MAPNLQIHGLCRFSYFGEDGNFQSTPSDEAARRAYLFDPVRMNQRLAWFEHVALPSVAGQTDKDFVLHLMLSEGMPEPFRARILALIADVPQIRPEFYPVAQPRLAYRDIMLSGRDAEAAMVAEFRLDDDDAMAHGFVARVRRHAVLAERLFLPRQQRAALDFGLGLVLDVDENGKVEVIPVHARTWPCALAVYLRPHDSACVMDFPHHRISHLMPVLSYPRPMMYARGRHGGNDSKIFLDKARNMSPEDGAAHLMPDFGIDLDAFRTAMAKLHQQAGAAG
ncbi:hypothetical protein ACMU_04690 [Actibacterium mucosum KCTC 23349]|uniref:Rhamnosyl transferase n=1 Tax=Actibacterium mucosum KCTC 23349 TaxID=1454373 RepID=A0A037ZBZ6_9RHOB|nr:glycosyltransferase [Actibacterium mucosum]KAJ54004.1 hypothetical protein ACMU_04690 [Actibacterium mucosum KCTC 23349]